MPGIGLSLGRKFIGNPATSWNIHWPRQTGVLFFGLYSEISGGQMPNKIPGATDFLTVAGSAGSETYQAPNTASYQSADTDYIWFKTDVSQRTTTTAELIGYDFTRTIIKYANSSPYAIEAIMILSSDVDTAKMRDDFDLSIWWSDVLSAHGNVKGNRGVGKSVWTAESVYEDELNTYISGLAIPLSTGQKTLLNNFIITLKTDLSIANLSEAFDVMHIFAGETQESSLKNLVKNAHHCTIVGGTQTFTALEGFTGDGAGSYLKTDYNPSTQGVRYALTDAHIAVYYRTDGGVNQQCGMGYPTEMWNGNSSNFNRCWINSTEFDVVTLTWALGFKILTRTIGGVHAHYINGAGGIAWEAPTGLVEDLYFNYASSGQISFGCVGKYFTLTQHNKIRDAFETYMDANGKGVIT